MIENPPIPKELLGDDWYERLTDRFLQVAKAEFDGLPSVPVLSVTLDREDIDIYDTATVTQAVQVATGKLGFGIRNPSIERTRSIRSDRESARLVSIGQTGHTLYFGFPHYKIEEGLNFAGMRFETLAEGAVNELINILPSRKDDDVALDALVAQKATIRSATSDIVDAVQKANTGLEFRFEMPGVSTITSILSTEQAALLADSLSEVDTERTIVTRTGFLDGVRTTRRIFYLQPENETEIHGGIDAELLPELYRLMAHTVDVELERTVLRTYSGRVSFPRYRMTAVSEHKTIF